MGTVYSQVFEVNLKVFVLEIEQSLALILYVFSNMQTF